MPPAIIGGVLTGLAAAAGGATVFTLGTTLSAIVIGVAAARGGFGSFVLPRRD
jgi:hypothetical protein